MLVCCGKNAKYIVESAENNGMAKENVNYFENREQVEKFVRDNWQSGDSILFKASNGMKFFNIVENLIK